MTIFPQPLDEFLSLHFLPLFLKGCARVEIVLDEVLREAFVVCQAVEVGVEPSAVCRHECEELGIDEFLLLLDSNFIWEYLLEVAVDLLNILVQGEEDLRFDVEQLLALLVFRVKLLLDGFLRKTGNEEVANERIRVLLDTGRVLH